MGGCYLLKFNGGDVGIRIPVLYWRCPLIRVSVIRGSTVYNTATLYSKDISCVYDCVIHNIGNIKKVVQI
jgi:hypothetical protein